MPNKKILVDYNFNQNELQNAVAQNLATAPNNPKEGQFYYNTTDDTLYVYANGAWVNALTQGKTYTAGTGIDITSAVISIDTTVVAQKSDLPTKISDLTDDTATYPIDKADTLTGLTASISELNIMDGVTVTAANINSVTSKIGLSDLSIASASNNYLTYSNSTGQFGAKVDTTVSASSTNLITSGAVSTAIENAIIGGVKYVGTWTATSQTDYSSITLPVKKGYMYLVEGSATITAGGTTIEWNAGDYLMVNADVASGGTLTNVSKIDNTEGTDIVRLNAVQTLTNKTIDGDDNTIQDLGTGVFKSGVLQTSIRSSASASNTALATEKAIATAIELLPHKISANNGALTASSGVCTWTIANTLGTGDVQVTVKDVSTNEVVETAVTANSSSVTITINSSANISADTYRAIIIG